jgi:hypothetical protein
MMTGGNRIMMTVSKRVVLLALLASMGLCGGAFASATWLCSIASAVAVDEDGTVGPPDLGDMERPTFFRVDSDKKEVTLLAPDSRRGEVTKIDAVREVNGLWVFSGVENDRAWSLIITAKGQVTLSISHDGVVWSVFGHALSEGANPAGESKEKK